LNISREVAQKFEYFDCDILTEVQETLNLIQDARINDKNFFSSLEINIFEEIINKLLGRLKEVRTFLDNFEELCNELNMKHLFEKILYYTKKTMLQIIQHV